MRTSRWVLVVVLGLACVRYAMAASAMPPVVASHFGADGKPNGWMSRDAFAWFGIIPFGAVVLVSFVGQILVAVLPPNLINLPNKDYWLAPERKDETVRRFGAYIEWFGVAMTALLWLVYEQVFEANARQGPIHAHILNPALVGFFAFAIGWLVMFYRAFAVRKE